MAIGFSDKSLVLQHFSNLFGNCWWHFSICVNWPLGKRVFSFIALFVTLWTITGELAPRKKFFLVAQIPKPFFMKGGITNFYIVLRLFKMALKTTWNSFSSLIRHLRCPYCPKVESLIALSKSWKRKKISSLLVYVLYKTWNEAFSRRSRAKTAKKCTKSVMHVQSCCFAYYR